MFDKHIRTSLRKLRRKSGSTHDTEKYWEARYQGGGNSGAGSYGHLAEFKAEFLNDFVDRNGIENVLELGCGDGNQLGLARYPHYTGVDISTKALAICGEKYIRDSTKEFHCEVPLERLADGYDLTMSLDVIFHLVKDSLFHTYMEKLFRASSDFVIIYSSNVEDKKFLSEFPNLVRQHVKHRRFTDWIETNLRNWKHIATVPNPYPFDPQRPNETSFAEFYVYKKCLD